MTRALRRRHRVAFALLAIGLPVGVGVALVVRPVLPPVASTETALDAGAHDAAATAGPHQRAGRADVRR